MIGYELALAALASELLWLVLRLHLEGGDHLAHTIGFPRQQDGFANVRAEYPVFQCNFGFARSRLQSSTPTEGTKRSFMFCMLTLCSWTVIVDQIHA